MTDAFSEIADLVQQVIGTQVAGTTATSLPRADVDEPGVDVCLLGVTIGAKEVHRRQQRLHRLPVQLEFLAAVAGPPASLPALLYDLCAAVEATSELELGSLPVPLDWWVALGATPRPAVRVVANAHIDRLIDPGALVTDPIRLEPHILDGKV